MTKKHAFVVLDPELYEGYISSAVDKIKGYVGAELKAIHLTENTDAANMFLEQLPERVKKAVGCVADFYLGELGKDCKREYLSRVSKNLRRNSASFSICQDPFLQKIGTSLEDLANDIKQD